MPQVDIATRLKPYSLNAPDVTSMLTNLTVAGGQKLRLTKDAPNMSGHIKELPAKQLVDLKRMIGVPDEAAAHVAPRPVFARPPISLSRVGPQLTAAQHASLYVAARNAILSHSSSISPLETNAVNQWLGTLNPVIIIGLFQDITVEANSQLIVAPDIQVLFANNILVQQGGQIICQGTITKIDCASLKGFEYASGGAGTGT